MLNGVCDDQVNYGPINFDDYDYHNDLRFCGLRQGKPFNR